MGPMHGGEHPHSLDRLRMKPQAAAAIYNIPNIPSLVRNRTSDLEDIGTETLAPGNSMMESDRHLILLKRHSTDVEFPVMNPVI